MTTVLDTTAALTPPSSETDVRFQEIAPHQWRVLDTRVPEEDVTALLGFVAVIAGVFEVTVIARPQQILFCPDERAARMAFLDRIEQPSAPALDTTV